MGQGHNCDILFLFGGSSGKVEDKSLFKLDNCWKIRLAALKVKGGGSFLFGKTIQEKAPGIPGLEGTNAGCVTNAGYVTKTL